jgi:hypothetical protein
MTVFCYAYGMYTFGDIKPTKPIGAGKVPRRLVQPFTLAELTETWGKKRAFQHPRDRKGYTTSRRTTTGEN